MYNIAEGDHWAALEVTGIESRQVTIKDRAVTETYHAVFLKLHCDCGNDVEIERRKFPGKRRMRDCGCGSAGPAISRGAMTHKQARQKGATSRKVIMSLYVELDLIEQIDEYAVQNKLSTNRGACELLRLGLASL